MEQDPIARANTLLDQVLSDLQNIQSPSEEDEDDILQDVSSSMTAVAKLSAIPLLDQQGLLILEKVRFITYFLKKLDEHDNGENYF